MNGSQENSCSLKRIDLVLTGGTGGHMTESEELPQFLGTNFLLKNTYNSTSRTVALHTGEPI